MSQPESSITESKEKENVNSQDEYAKYRLMEFKHWTLYLHNEQYPYIGRCVAAANRKEADVLTDGTLEEYTELHMKIIPLWVSTCEKLYEMDRPNLAILGNTWNHLHAHLIPRYHKVKTFHKIEFFDENPTGMYAPYKKMDIQPQIIDNIISEMKQELQNQSKTTSEMN